MVPTLFRTTSGDGYKFVLNNGNLLRSILYPTIAEATHAKETDSIKWEVALARCYKCKKHYPVQMWKDHKRAFCVSCGNFFKVQQDKIFWTDLDTANIALPIQGNRMIAVPEVA